jgi:tRNA(Ile)-lysidine synthase
VAGPAPAVAAVRHAVRAEIADLPSGALVLAACSGGADSTALAAGLAFVAPRSGYRAGALVVDHAWRAGSAARAATVAARLGTLGLDPVRVLTAPADRSEAGARRARYAALDAAAAGCGAAAVLLGHTLDDQAETVLLGLARGSGARSLAGMPRRRAGYRRPLLDLPRATGRAACAALGLPVEEDPANDDDAFARVRVRRAVLPVVESALGPGCAAALARTARLLADDADALDALAAAVADPADVVELAGLPPAVRRRVLKRLLEPPAVTAAHLAAVEALVTRWQGPVALPGGRTARRAAGRIAVHTPPAPRSTVPDRVPEPGPDSRPHPSPAGPPDGDSHPDIATVLVPSTAIAAKVAELGARISRDYAGREVLLIGVLKGAVMIMADLARALTVPATMEFMAVSSYGSSTSSSGVVRILKDLDRDITGRHVLVVEDIIDSGLTLSWLLRNLCSRDPASVEVVTLLRKPEAMRTAVDVRYVGFDIPSEFVVGYGLDYAERYRNLPFVGVLTERAQARPA